MLRDEQEIGEMEANLLGDLRPVTIPVFKYHPEGFKLVFFLVHKHSNVKKSRPYILSLSDRKAFYASYRRCP